MESLLIQLLGDLSYKSQFKKNYAYDWFCGPGLHLLILAVPNLLKAKENILFDWLFSITRKEQRKQSNIKK